MIAVTWSGPAIFAHRSRITSCRCLAQNVGVGLSYGGSSSMPCSHRWYSTRMPFCKNCCQDDGRIFTSGRNVATMWTRARDDGPAAPPRRAAPPPYRVVRALAQPLAADHHPLLAGVRGLVDQL